VAKRPQEQALIVYRQAVCTNNRSATLKTPWTRVTTAKQVRRQSLGKRSNSNAGAVDLAKQFLK